jgi:hypothetical protein
MNLRPWPIILALLVVGATAISFVWYQTSEKTGTAQGTFTSDPMVGDTYNSDRRSTDEVIHASKLDAWRLATRFIERHWGMPDDAVSLPVMAEMRMLPNGHEDVHEYNFVWRRQGFPADPPWDWILATVEAYHGQPYVHYVVYKWFGWPDSSRAKQMADDLRAADDKGTHWQLGAGDNVRGGLWLKALGSAVPYSSSTASRYPSCRLVFDTRDARRPVIQLPKLTFAEGLLWISGNGSARPYTIRDQQTLAEMYLAWSAACISGHPTAQRQADGGALHLSAIDLVENNDTQPGLREAPFTYRGACYLERDLRLRELARYRASSLQYGSGVVVLAKNGKPVGRLTITNPQAQVAISRAYEFSCPSGLYQ